MKVPFLCSRRDSNPYLQNRNLKFYPLNYGNNTVILKGCKYTKLRYDMTSVLFKIICIYCKNTDFVKYWSETSELLGIVECIC